MVAYLLRRPADFAERAAGTVLFLRDDWREQLAESVPRTLLAFQFVGDDNPRHNLPFAPLLGWGAAMLAPIGLVACAGRWRQPPSAAVLLWFGAALLAPVATLEAPHATRLLDAIVPIALMVGVAVDLGATAVRGLVGRRTALGLSCLAVAAAGWAARDEWRTYFVAREQRPEFFDAFFPHESAAARYLAAHAPDATVYLDPDTYWHPALPFVARRYLDEPNDIRPLHLLHDFPPRQPLARDALSLLPRPYASFAAVLRSLSPETTCDESRDPFGRIDLVACRVPRDAINRVAGGPPPSVGLAGRVWADAARSGPPVPVALPFSYCPYPLDAPPLGRFALAEWEGSIDVPRQGTYLFRLHPDTTTLTIDGRRVIDDAGEGASGGGHEGRIALTAGRHPIRITLRPGPQGRYFLWFFWEPPGEEGGWVPADALHPPAEDGLAPQSARR
ncbi:MAG: PA14 domain-containing protein [Candidatus Binatia bacterium]